jgi:hypothetical protein
MTCTKNIQTTIYCCDCKIHGSSVIKKSYSRKKLEIMVYHSPEIWAYWHEIRIITAKLWGELSLSPMIELKARNTRMNNAIGPPLNLKIRQKMIASQSKQAPCNRSRRSVSSYHSRRKEKVHHFLRFDQKLNVSSRCYYCYASI